MKQRFTPSKEGYRHVLINFLKVVKTHGAPFIVLLILSIRLSAQNAPVTVLGTIKDSKGIILPGVSIKVKGTQIRALSNSEGKYTIKVSNQNSVLVFSSVGFVTREQNVGLSKLINVVLIEDNNDLNEVVVIGYGEMKKKDLTGSVGTVNMKDLAKAPVKSFDDALAGRVAGVVVSGNDGSPGTLNNIVIRGGNSITQDNSPLYVVDGFPLEAADFNDINPADIESIDVLKDASATAIYGARGANGVIIITTKKGMKGDPVIGYNGYYGLQKISKTIDVMSPYEFVRFETELNPTFVSSYTPGALNPSDPNYDAAGRTLDYYRNVPGINWQSLLFRTAPMQNHDISLRGGNAKTTYSISGNILSQDGIFLNSGFGRSQGRVVLNQTVNTKLKVGLNVNYSHTTITGQKIATDESNGSLNLMYAVLGYRPVTGNDNVDLIDDLTDPDAASTNYSVNPLINAQNAYREITSNSLIANGFIEYAITKNLTFKSTGGITSKLGTNENFNNSNTLGGSPRSTKGGPNGSTYNSINNTWLNENLLTYNKAFDRNNRLNVIGGFSLQSNTSSTKGFEGRLVPNESLGVDGLDEGITQIGSSASSRWKLASFLGRANYSYKSKYLATMSIRADGSSRFAAGHQWAYFPSGSIAWRMSEENFMQKLKFINDAKLRISYGSTGNNRISEFSYLSQLQFAKTDTYSYDNTLPAIGVALKLLGNPDLVWETTDQFNIGYDLSLFNNRISFVTDIYRKVTHNLLLDAQLPYTTGLTHAFKNIGRMSNDGLEFTINTTNIRNKNFTWSTSFNISFNRNKVLALTENENSLLSIARFTGDYNGLSSYIALIGAPVAQMRGLIWDGVYQYSDFDHLPDGRYLLKDNITTNGDVRKNIQPGDIKYKDLNGDLVADSRDYTVIGRALPIHTGGLSNNFTYKGFDLSVFLQWSYGNDILNANRLVFEGNGSGTGNLNQFASFEDRWSPTNTTSQNFRAAGRGPVAISSRVIEDGSYLRLKTVSLGYNFGSTLLNKIKLKNLRVYVSAQNIFTLTNYTGFDPEVSVNNSPLTPGFDYAPYPRARTLVFGLNTSF